MIINNANIALSALFKVFRATAERSNFRKQSITTKNTSKKKIIYVLTVEESYKFAALNRGVEQLVARRAHNPKVIEPL